MALQYLHYVLDDSNLSVLPAPPDHVPTSLPGQFVNCDVRSFDMSVLGKFSVIMADPPWDIHMSARRLRLLWLLMRCSCPMVQ